MGGQPVNTWASSEPLHSGLHCEPRIAWFSEPRAASELSQAAQPVDVTIAALRGPELRWRGGDSVPPAVLFHVNPSSGGAAARMPRQAGIHHSSLGLILPSELVVVRLPWTYCPYKALFVVINDPLFILIYLLNQVPKGILYISDVKNPVAWSPRGTSRFLICMCSF